MAASSTAICRASTICMVRQTEPIGSNFASLGRAKMLREFAADLREIVARFVAQTFGRYPPLGVDSAEIQATADYGR